GVVELVRVIELREVLAGFPVEVDNVAQMVEERGAVTGADRRELVLQLAGHNRLGDRGSDPAGVPHNVKHQPAGWGDGIGPRRSKDISQPDPVGGSACRRGQWKEPLIAPCLLSYERSGRWMAQVGSRAPEDTCLTHHRSLRARHVQVILVSPAL